MMILVRFVILVVIIIAFVIIPRTLIKKLKPEHLKTVSKIYTFFVILVTLLYLISWVFPIENAFVSFSSPEAAYKYSFPIDSIQFTVEGEQSAFVLGKSPFSRTYKDCVVKKSDNGWKITSNNGKSAYDHYGNEKEVFVIVNLIHMPKTDDYYVCVNPTYDNANVSDNRNSTFYQFNYAENSAEYYAYVNGIDDNYVVNINGQEVHINNLIAKVQ